MHDLYKLRETLVKELCEYGAKGDMSASILDVVDKLAHAAKNIDKIIEDDDSGMSERYPTAYDMGRSGMRSYRRSYDDGSYARRRDRMGRYARDGGSMRGYSRDGGDMIKELREMMENAPDDRTRQEFQRMIDNLE